jgi:hypothetical protein
LHAGWAWRGAWTFGSAFSYPVDQGDVWEQVALELRGRPLRVDEVMMGCAFIGQQDEANATVAAALEAGIDWFDTAAAYGESEVDLILDSG